VSETPMINVARSAFLVIVELPVTIMTIGAIVLVSNTQSYLRLCSWWFVYAERRGRGETPLRYDGSIFLLEVYGNPRESVVFDFGPVVDCLGLL
jgi:hypothetical protein